MVYIENSLDVQEVYIPRNDQGGAYISPYDKGYEDGYQDGLNDAGDCPLTVGEIVVTQGFETFEPPQGYVGFSEVDVDARQYGLKEYNEGHKDGKEEGKEEQKALMTAVTFTENGEYEREDGWSAVTVDVPQTGSTCNLETGKEISLEDGDTSPWTVVPSSGYDGMDGVTVTDNGYGQGKYDEGYDDGHEKGTRDQKALLSSTAFTQNGEYTRENGWDEVSVNVQPNLQQKAINLNSGDTSPWTVVPDSGYDGFSGVMVVDDGYGQGKYDDGYNQGKEDGFDDGVEAQKSLLTSAEFTRNGQYIRSDGWDHVSVNVPQTGASCDLQHKTVSQTAQTQTYYPDITAAASIGCTTAVWSVNNNINTGIHPTTATTMRIKYIGRGVNPDRIMGVHTGDGASENSDLRFFQASTSVYLDYNTERNQLRNTTITLSGTKYDLSFGNNFLYDNINSTSLLTGSLQSVCLASGCTIRIDVGGLWVEEAIIYEDGVEVFHGVATNSNGTIGLYDVVTQQMFTFTSTTNPLIYNDGSIGFDGMSAITVNASAYGETRYVEGQNNVRNSMTSTTFTQNGVYSGTNGWTAVTVDVLTTGSTTSVTMSSVTQTFEAGGQITHIVGISADSYCYFDTGIIPDINTEYDITFIPLAGQRGNFNGFIGAQDTDDGDSTFQIRRTSSNTFEFRIGSVRTTTDTYTNTNEYHLIFNKSGKTINGTTYSFNASSMEECHYTAFINGIHNPAWTTSGGEEPYRAAKAIYKEVIIRKNGVEVFHAIPAIDNDEACFYDTISGNYIYNLGTGSPSAVTETFTNDVWSAVTVNASGLCQGFYNSGYTDGQSSIELQSKSVVLTAATQTIVPDSGYDGMNAVMVDATDIIEEECNACYEQGFNDGVSGATSQIGIYQTNDKSLYEATFQRYDSDNDWWINAQYSNLYVGDYGYYTFNPNNIPTKFGVYGTGFYPDRQLSRASKLNFIQIPNSIELMKQDCFGETTQGGRMRNLTKVVLPSGLLEISADEAFNTCNALTEIVATAPVGPTVDYSPPLGVTDCLPPYGKLYVPSGSTNYNDFISLLPEGWTVVTGTPSTAQTQYTEMVVIAYVDITANNYSLYNPTANTSNLIEVKVNGSTYTGQTYTGQISKIEYRFTDGIPNYFFKEMDFGYVAPDHSSRVLVYSYNQNGFIGNGAFDGVSGLPDLWIFNEYDNSTLTIKNGAIANADIYDIRISTVELTASSAVSSNLIIEQNAITDLTIHNVYLGANISDSTLFYNCPSAINLWTSDDNVTSRSWYQNLHNNPNVYLV